MATDSLWISISAKRQDLVLNENLIICIEYDMLFSDVMAKMYPTHEENIEVRVYCYKIKRKMKFLCLKCTDI